MFRNKKAQAAMEFLMTYGWAILIVLAVIATLTSFGVLNTDIFIPSKCVLGTAGMMNCIDYTVVKSGTSDNVRVFFVIEGSSLPDNTNVEKFYLTGGDVGDGVECGGAVNSGYTAPNGYASTGTVGTTTVMPFPRNTKQTFYIGDENHASLIFKGGNCAGLASQAEGSKIKASLVMEYKVGSSPEVKKFRGEIVAPIEYGDALTGGESCSGATPAACSTLDETECGLVTGCTWA